MVLSDISHVKVGADVLLFSTELATEKLQTNIEKERCVC